MEKKQNVSNKVANESPVCRARHNVVVVVVSFCRLRAHLTHPSNESMTIPMCYNDEIQNVFSFCLKGDRFLSEPRHDKLSYMEEVHSAQRKVNDLQTHLKFLESKLAERDAEIRILQENKGKSIDLKSTPKW